MAAHWQSLTTAENVAEIHRQMGNGVKPRALAAKVQAFDPPMFAGRSVSEVSRWFGTYCRKIVEPERAASLREKVWSMPRHEMRRRLDVIADLEDIAVALRGRFDKWLVDEQQANEQQAKAPLAAVDALARNYRITLVEIAKLYLETGLLHRVPRKIEAALTTARAGRPVFEFTAEEVEQFDRTRLIEGMTAETIDDGRLGDDGRPLRDRPVAADDA